MRIRKRKVPLPLSLLSPVPISDPHLFSRSPVILVQEGASGGDDDDDGHDINRHNTNSHPSDHFNLRRPIVGNSTTDHGVMGFGEGEREQNNNEQPSNASIPTTRGAATTAASNNDNNNNNEEEGRWCDGDRSIPLKKRRGSFNINVEHPIKIEKEKEKEKTTLIMKSKTNNKSVIKTDEDLEEEETTKNNNNMGSSGKKGGKRGSTIMEGSRCSRVNGRGWRCCQPTLVGYSLCEHHLGKGRLRSMTSVKGRASTNTKKSVANVAAPPLPTPVSHTTTVEDSSVGVINRRLKLGVVKARSLSSLLGQTHSTITNLDPHQ